MSACGLSFSPPRTRSVPTQHSYWTSAGPLSPGKEGTHGAPKSPPGHISFRAPCTGPSGTVPGIIALINQTAGSPGPVPQAGHAPPSRQGVSRHPRRLPHSTMFVSEAGWAASPYEYDDAPIIISPPNWYRQMTYQGQQDPGRRVFPVGRGASSGVRARAIPLALPRLGAPRLCGAGPDSLQAAVGLGPTAHSPRTYAYEDQHSRASGHGTRGQFVG